MNDRDERHFVKSAGAITDATCIGRFMAVNVEHIFLNIKLSGHNYEKERIDKPFTLARILFTNNWNHRIEISEHKCRMIDTEGMQHHTAYFDAYAEDIRVRVSKSHEISYKFECLQAEELEGQSRIRRWLWFPALPKGIYPHRLIFKFWIFAPGNTSGTVQASETIEIVFAFKFTEPLPSGQAFVPLEIEGGPN